MQWYDRDCVIRSMYGLPHPAARKLGAIYTGLGPASEALVAQIRSATLQVAHSISMTLGYLVFRWRKKKKNHRYRTPTLGYGP